MTTLISDLDRAIDHLVACGWTSEKCPLGLLRRARAEIVKLHEELRQERARARTGFVEAEK